MRICSTTLICPLWLHIHVITTNGQFLEVPWTQYGKFDGVSSYRAPPPPFYIPTRTLPLPFHNPIGVSEVANDLPLPVMKKAVLRPVSLLPEFSPQLV